MKYTLILLLFVFSISLQAQNTIGVAKKDLIAWAKTHSLPCETVDSLKIVRYQIQESVYEAHLLKDTVKLINVFDAHKRLSKIKQKYDEALYMLDKFRWIEFYGKKEFEYSIIFPDNKEIIVTQITLLQ